MALAHKIKKTAYDKLSDEFKAEYIAGDTEGEYVLDVTGLPEPEDVGPIKRALDKEKEAVKTLKKDKATLQAQVDDMPDVTKIEADHAAATSKLTKFVDKTLRESKALELATKISTVPSLLSSKIAERLQVDMTGDEPKTVILGKDGKPDATMDFDKLSQEFVANPDFKTIIIASKATGGGSVQPQHKPDGGGTPNGNQDKPVDLTALNGKDLAARIAERKAAEAQQ